MAADYIRKYFVVEPGTPLHAGHDQAIEQETKFRQAAIAFGKAHGSDQAIVTGGRLQGLEWSDNEKVPVGWRWSKKFEFYIPNLKTKVGKQIAIEIKALPKGLGNRGWSHVVGSLHFAGAYVYYPTFEQYGSVLVFSCHEECDPLPQGYRELLMSEFWKLKETGVLDG